MATLTVFTPAYNRSHTIERTYRSLCAQTSRDFEWLVIDDGSQDDTYEKVQKWAEEADFKIRVIRQKNQGMHGAHNTAYRNITTELNTCIDSDDWMPADAVETIVRFWHEHGSVKYAGILGLDQREDGSIIGTDFPADMISTTLQGFYAGGGSGDKKIVYRTDVVTRNPEYPLFEGERYVGLAYKYMLIDQDMELLTVNKPLVTVEYQADGSSVNMYRQYWRNPKGFSFFRRTEMVCAPTLRRRFMSCVHYVATSIIAHDSKMLSKSPKKLMTIAAMIPGVLWYMQIRRCVKRDKKMEIK